MLSWKKVFKYLRSDFPGISKDILEDITQDALKKGFMEGRLENPTEKDLAWLKTVARRNLLDFLKRENRITTTDQLPEKNEKNDSVKLPPDVEEALEKLEDRLLWKKRLEGYDWKKIAQMYGIKYETVMQRKRRLEKQLRKMLKKCAHGGGKTF